MMEVSSSVLVVASNNTFLSRTEVYASLQSYNNVNGDGSNSKAKKLPKRLQDGALLSFYAEVSSQYHRTVPYVDGKNTAARPLSIGDITSRISQRAITFVNHYNSTGTTAARKKKIKHQKKKKLSTELVPSSSSFNISSSQRKRKRQNLVQRINRQDKNAVSYNMGAVVHDDAHSSNSTQKSQQQMLDLHFVRQLNSEWNRYIRNLLQLDYTNKESNDIDLDTTETLNFMQNREEQRISSLLLQMMNRKASLIEWVGAFVRIVNITKKNRNNMNTTNAKNIDLQRQQQETNIKPKSKITLPRLPIEGVLISHTPNHWTIVPIAVSDDDNDNNCFTMDQMIDIDQQQRKRRTVVTLLPKVSIDKSTVVVTVRIPIIGKTARFVSLFDIHDDTDNEIQFLNIHLRQQLHSLDNTDVK